MSCDVGEVTERLENEQRSNIHTAKLILQPFCCFRYITAHSPSLLLLYLHHSSFFNPSVASPTSQFILQPFFRFSYVTSSSLNSPGEPTMISFVSLICIFAYNFRTTAPLSTVYSTISSLWSRLCFGIENVFLWLVLQLWQKKNWNWNAFSKFLENFREKYVIVGFGICSKCQPTALLRASVSAHCG